MTIQHTPGPHCWLWPDRAITKRESRALREEHNAVVNFNADLLAVVEWAELALQTLDRNAESIVGIVRRVDGLAAAAASDTFERMKRNLAHARAVLARVRGSEVSNG